MSRDMSRKHREAVRAWHDGLHDALDRGQLPRPSSNLPSGRVVEHCCDAMAAVRVQEGTAGSDDDPTVDVRILLSWGAFEVGLSPPDDPEGEWVLRLRARDRNQGEVDILATALRQAADLVDATHRSSNEARVALLPYRSNGRPHPTPPG